MIKMGNLVDIIKTLLKAFFDAFFSIFTDGIWNWINFSRYIALFKDSEGGLQGIEKVTAIAFLCMLLFITFGVIYMVLAFLGKIVRLKSRKIKTPDLLEEITRLRHELVKSERARDKILGLKMDPSGVVNANIDSAESQDQNSEATGEEKKTQVSANDSRFYKLTEIDQQYANYDPPEFNKTITLEELCDRFRNFAASRMRLYYQIRVVRLFVAAYATTRLVILQGISGTGKTSLPYAWGIFLQNPTTITAVQPSWRDKTELFGYFNEFTKKFNETEVLKKMYEATYTDDIYITVLDEMNIARVEYYFAEMLSLLEMPSRDNWIIDLVPSGWPSDPKHVLKGRFKIPPNMFYVGTANNDDSTFAISDKVYDRALPININTKGIAFEAPDTEPLKLSFEHIEALYTKAKEENKVSEENLKKVEILDNYVIEHFRLAFGNRIVKQLKEFIPAFVACGGTEIDGLDYVLCNKIFRKFEGLNLSYIRDEIDGLVEKLDELFGAENMQESKEYVLRLKKLF